MKEKIQKFREYLDYIERHYDNVQKAWKLIYDKCKDKKPSFRWVWDDYVWGAITEDVKNHDSSKLSVYEFCQYRQWFFPCEYEVKRKEIFIEAWEHHKRNNFHHWQNWTIKQKHNPYADIFLVCMLVDWVAMSFEFGGTAKDYYEANKNEIKLPEWAIKEMYEIFNCIY